MRIIDILGGTLITVALGTVCFDVIGDVSYSAPAPISAPDPHIVDPVYSVRERFFNFVASDRCADLIPPNVDKLSRKVLERNHATSALEECWNRFNPEL